MTTENTTVVNEMAIIGQMKNTLQEVEVSGLVEDPEKTSPDYIERLTQTLNNRNTRLEFVMS